LLSGGMRASPLNHNGYWGTAGSLP
jgi:hypothetical protein